MSRTSSSRVLEPVSVPLDSALPLDDCVRFGVVGYHLPVQERRRVVLNNSAVVAFHDEDRLDAHPLNLIQNVLGDCVPRVLSEVVLVGFPLPVTVPWEGGDTTSVGVLSEVTDDGVRFTYRSNECSFRCWRLCVVV